MRWTWPTRKLFDETKWHYKFAWWPTRIGIRTIVWLEYYECRLNRKEPENGIGVVQEWYTYRNWDYVPSYIGDTLVGTTYQRVNWDGPAHEYLVGGW